MLYYFATALLTTAEDFCVGASREHSEIFSQSIKNTRGANTTKGRSLFRKQLGVTFLICQCY